MSIPDNLYKKKKKNSHSVSILFLIIVIISTIILYIYNTSISSDIDKVRLAIANIDNLTENIKKDEKVQIYSLIEANKKTLERMKYISQVPDFIEHFKLIWKKYKVNLESFNYSWWKLTSELSFEDINEITYLRVVNFIKGYRTSKDSLFDLKFIKSIEWQKNIKFAISLDLKEPPKKVEIIEDKNTNIKEEKVIKKDKKIGKKSDIIKTNKKVKK